jgi:trehalose 6-phosphate phosphatase
LAAPGSTGINIDRYEAAILDMDGVITRSAGAHMAAWRRMFNEYLKTRAGRRGEQYLPFTDADYYRYVDGKPRYEGARSFLESRGIILPTCSPEDPPDRETICGLGNLKNRYFLEHLKNNGVESYPSTLAFVRDLNAGNKSVAAISSSRNAKAVLVAAGVRDLFPVVVDGVDAAARHLKGKPEPDIFLEAARQLSVSPGRTIVVEDALAGVAAGKAGGFALVIGINRTGNNTELGDHGADIVVGDLSEINWSESDEEHASK